MADEETEQAERADDNSEERASEKEDSGSTEVPPEVKAALKKANKEAETLRHKLKEYEDAEKSEQGKLNERVSTAEKRADDAEARALRLEVASEKSLTKAQAKRLVGSTQEELEADADELLETFGVKKSEDDGKESRRPKEKLHSGASAKEEPEQSPDELADAVLKQSRGG